MARLLGFNVEDMLEKTGRLACEHKLVVGLPLAEVWTHANEVAIAAVKSRPGPDQRGLLVLKSFAKALLALQELAEVSGLARQCPAQPPTSKSLTTRGLPSPLKPTCTTLALVPNQKPQKEKGVGPCHRHVVELETMDLQNCDSLVVPAKFFVATWKKQLVTALGWFFVAFPVGVQVFVAVLGLMTVYLVCRPRLVARLFLEFGVQFVNYIRMSGGEIIGEIDAFVWSWITGRPVEVPMIHTPNVVIENKVSSDETVAFVAAEFERSGMSQKLGSNSSEGQALLLQAALVGAQLALQKFEAQFNTGSSLYTRLHGPSVGTVSTPQTGSDSYETTAKASAGAVALMGLFISVTKLGKGLGL